LEFDDPSLEPTFDAQRRACEHVANGLAGRLRIWMSLPDIRRRVDQSVRVTEADAHRRASNLEHRS